jgi:hypothetical protein
MRWYRITLLIAAGAAAASTIGAPATARFPTTAPTTVVVTKQIQDFAADRGYIAWTTYGTNGCRVYIRALAAAVQHVVSGGTPSARHPWACADVQAPTDLALAGDRALWAEDEATPCGDGPSTRVRAGGFRQRPKTLEQFAAVCVGDTVLAAMAGSMQTLLYAKVVEDIVDVGGTLPRIRVTGGTTTRVVLGRPTKLRGLPPVAAIAASAQSIAIVPAAPDQGTGDFLIWPPLKAAVNGAVQIRNAISGALVTSFAPSGTVDAIALSRRVAVVLVRGPGRTLQIVGYDARTGEFLRAVAVPRQTGRRLDVEGSRVVFRVDRSIRVFDIRTGRHFAVWRADSVPVDVSIDGNVVAWAESSRGTSRIRVITLAP